MKTYIVYVILFFSTSLLSQSSNLTATKMDKQSKAGGIVAQDSAQVVFSNLDKKIRYAISLYERNKKKEANDELNKIIEGSKDDSTIVQAMYFKILWNVGRSGEILELYEKMAAYYPDNILTKSAGDSIDNYMQKNAIVKLVYSANVAWPYQMKPPESIFGTTMFNGIEINEVRVWNPDNTYSANYDYDKEYILIDTLTDICKPFPINPEFKFNTKYSFLVDVSKYGKTKDDWVNIKGREGKRVTVRVTTPPYKPNVCELILKFEVDNLLQINNPKIEYLMKNM